MPIVAKVLSAAVPHFTDDERLGAAVLVPHDIGALFRRGGKQLHFDDRVDREVEGQNADSAEHEERSLRLEAVAEIVRPEAMLDLVHVVGLSEPYLVKLQNE